MQRVHALIGGLLFVGAATAALVATLRGTNEAGVASGAFRLADVASRDTRDSEPPDEDSNEPRSAGVDSGYAGTAAVRRRPVADTGAQGGAHGGRRTGRAAPPPVREQPAPSYFAGPGELSTLAAQLAHETRYPDMLQLLHRMGGKPRDGGDADRRADGSRRRTTRFSEDAPRMAKLLDEALAAATSGVVRQALIFHMAIALPLAEALPRLRALAAAADPEDAEDALCALAFTGDEDALTRFEALACSPTTCASEIQIWSSAIIDQVFADGRRDILRSYRCIEALDGAPYFHIHALWMDESERHFPWADAWERPPVQVIERALPAWLARYPGHAGSDDMAYRMAHIRIAQDRDVEALRWASFGADAPDGDMRHACIEIVTALVELSPAGSAVAEDVIDPAAPDRNRQFLLYLRLRRHAQERGFGAAVREADDLAASEPDLFLSQVWRDRWSAAPPRGVASGRAPLAAGDPLLRRAPAAGLPGYAPWMRVEDDPWISADRLRRQFRAWETLAELESRRARLSGWAALDLLYKEGAICFHEADVLYPIYAEHRQSDSGRPRCWLVYRQGGPIVSSIPWVRRTLSWNLAAERFEALVRLDPNHPLADDAVYSTALAHVKAADDRAVVAQGPEEQNRHLTAAIRAFEKLVAEYPDSPLAPSAQAALRYWRTARKDLL